MKLTTKGLVQTALLLTICIASQFFKNLSVYVTGPVVNTTIILGVLAVGLWSGIVIGILSPITAFFISGSPIMAAVPLMFPAVMGGNIILAVCVWFISPKKGSVRPKGATEPLLASAAEKKRLSGRLIAALAAGSVLKAVFMGIVIVLILLPSFGNNIAAKLPKPEALPGVLAAARITFSLTQLITAVIGSILAYLIWIPLKKYLEKGD